MKLRRDSPEFAKAAKSYGEAIVSANDFQLETRRYLPMLPSEQDLWRRWKSVARHVRKERKRRNRRLRGEKNYA